MWADGTGGTVYLGEERHRDALGELERSLRQYYVLSIPRLAGDPAVLDLEVEVTAG